MKNKQDRVNMQIFYSDVNSRPTIRRGEYKAIFLLEDSDLQRQPTRAFKSDIIFC